MFKYKYSKIYLKIKGEGENTILSNYKNYDFKGINYLKDVFINGDKQDTKKRAKGYYMRPVINIKRTKTFCVDDTTTDVGTINNPIIIGETCGW